MSGKRTFRPAVAHAMRVAVVVLLLWLIPDPRPEPPGSTDPTRTPLIEWVHAAIPAAVAIDSESNESGFWIVRDAAGQPIARAARTLPAAADVIGYRGPSEALILLDDQLNLIAVQLIASDDTEEHVAAVRSDRKFFDQFQRWTWTGPAPGDSVDAVSGATLTSLALAKAVLHRIGGDRPSLVFPDGIRSEELQAWFPDADEVLHQFDESIVRNHSGHTIGRVIRTGPLSDHIIGYQGPTELLIQLDTDDKISGLLIRSSFDNQPYVGYCKTESGFWALFQGRSLNEIAAMDLVAERVEGVSGATMTSLAIAETLVDSANRFCDRSRDRSSSSPSARTRMDALISGLISALISGLGSLTEIRLTPADGACLILLGAIPLFRFSGWFRKLWLRKLWLLAVVVVIGFWSGNLISMALIAGWSAAGIAWRLAPALAAIAIVALVSPIAGKSNPYCNHLCPHGAIQQLIRPGSLAKRRLRMPTRLIPVLLSLPGTLLVVAYLFLLLIPSTDLSSWEPFHAYLIRIAPWTSIALAVITLGVSACVPMGFCRFGCPTGRLLDHLRRSASSDRFSRGDAVALGLLILAGLVTWL